MPNWTLEAGFSAAFDGWLDGVPPRTGSVTPDDELASLAVQAPDASAVDAPAGVAPAAPGPELAPIEGADCGAPAPVSIDDDRLSAAAPDEPAIRTTSDGVPLSQILNDRPDVFRLFFSEYYGANNDRHSSAWLDRVGGATPEDYARYWYEHGGKDQYSPSNGAAARSPVDPSVYEGGRTTSDGVYLDQILHDRPDVYRLAFTEYYGPNNDRHSSAWLDRVGGTTAQDYAKYWYEHGGKYEYTPEPLKVDPPEPEAEAEAAPPPEPDDSSAWTPVEPTPVDDDAADVADAGGAVDPAILLVGQTLVGSDTPGA